MADKSLNLGTIFTADASQFFSTIGKMKASLKTLNTAYVQSGAAAKRGFSGVAPAVDKTSKAFDKGGNRVQEYSKQIGKVEGAFKRTVAAMKVTASYGIAATAIFAVTNAFKAGIKEIVDYDQALKNLQAITRATDAEVVGMGETIKHVAETTKFSTGEVAEGMVLLGQAGFSASEAMNAMQSVSDLATGTLGDMKTVTDLLTTTIRAFNLDTIESSRVADVMANAINRSKLTIDKLRVAFNFVGAAAAQSGLSIEEISASMMLLANNGLRASTIGTGLRQVLARLLAPNRKLRAEFEAQGIALDKVNPKTVGYQNAMKELTKILFDAETQTVDMGKAYQLFGLRGAQAVSVLVKGFAGTGFQGMLDKTYEVGTASEMAGIQMEGLGVMIKNLADRARLIAVAFGEGGATHAIKLFINALRKAVTAIIRFLETGLGKLIVSFGVVTGSTYLFLKAIALLIPAISSLMKMMLAAKLASVSWMATLISMSSHMTFARASSVMLGTSIANLAHPYLVAAAAVGILVAVVNYYLGSTQRAIDATVKLTQKTTNNVHALKVYSQILTVLSDKKKKGKKIDDEYITVLKRLIKSYPDLKNQIELSTKAFEKNAAAVNKALGIELQNNIEQSTRLVQLYTKAAEEARIKTGLWQSVVFLWEKYLDTLINIFDDFFGTIGRGWAKVLDVFSDIASKIPFIGTALSENLLKMKEIFGDLVGAAKNFFIGMGKDSEEATKAEEKRIGVLRDASKVMKEGGKSAKEITDELIKMGATEKDISKLTESFVDQKKALSDLEERYGGTLKDLPNMFSGFYEELDDLRKADFAKTSDAIDKEIAAFSKKNGLLSDGTEKRYEAEAAIRARNLLKFVDSSFKEILSEEELSKKKTEILDTYLQAVAKRYDEKTIIIHNTYQKELALAGENNDKLIAAHEKFDLAIVVAENERAKTIEGIQKVHNEKVKVEQKKIVDELRELHKKMAEDLINQLKSKYNELKGEVEKLMDDLKSLEESYNDAIRESKQKTMTEEEKWYDDRKELNRLMNEARTTNDEDTWKKAFDLAKSLGKEIEDEQGNVVKSIEETTRLSQRLMTEIHGEQMKLVRKEIAEREHQMDAIKEDITELEGLIKQYGEAVDEVSKKELQLRMEKALQSIGKAHDIVTKFKAKWDELKSKTITLTVKVNDQSGGKFDSGPDVVPEGKTGGVVKAKRGAKLPGFGGGDKVRALLEAGEWVIRKEAVQKYGSAMFAALNNLNFDVQDLLGGVMKKMGGFINPPVHKFQTGGATASEEGGGGTKIYNITFSPQFMTGDEMAMRAMAPELKRVLEDLDHRWGE